MSKHHIKIKAGFFIITLLIIGLGNSVIVSAKKDTPRDKLLGSIAVLKERIKDLEKIVKEDHLGSLGDKIEQIKEELDKMLGDKNKSIEQVEEKLSRAAEEARQKRIKEIEEKLNEQARKKKTHN